MPIEAPQLPELPEPWSVASTMKCAQCLRPCKPFQPGTMNIAGAAFLAPRAWPQCECGSAHFTAGIGYDSPSPAAYTAAQMRAYAQAAVEAERARWQADAQRYRWLRSGKARKISSSKSEGLIEVYLWQDRCEGVVLKAEALDYAIDTARGKPCP